MNDPRDPDARDGAPTAADDAPALVLETAPVDTSAAVGGDAAAAREAAAHFTNHGLARAERHVADHGRGAREQDARAERHGEEDRRLVHGDL